MNRVLFFVLGAVAIVCVAAVTAQAAAIPMVYNGTTSTVLVDWDMEGSGTPAVGSVLYFNPGTSNTSVATGGGSNPDAYEGSQMVRSYRGDSPTRANLSFGGASGSGDVITTTMAFRTEDNGSNAMSIFAGTTAAAENMAGFGFNANGAIVYYDDNAWQSTSLTHNVGQWNELVMTRTNGSASWELSVNGSTELITMGGGTGWLESYVGNLGGYTIASGAAGTLYFDAVPEPSSLVLSAAALMIMLIVRRKR